MRRVISSIQDQIIKVSLKKTLAQSQEARKPGWAGSPTHATRDKAAQTLDEPREMPSTIGILPHSTHHWLPSKECQQLNPSRFPSSCPTKRMPGVTLPTFSISRKQRNFPVHQTSLSPSVSK